MHSPTPTDTTDMSFAIDGYYVRLLVSYGRYYVEISMSNILVLATACLLAVVIYQYTLSKHVIIIIIDSGV
jgi:hypothetical protein